MNEPFRVSKPGAYIVDGEDEDKHQRDVALPRMRHAPIDCRFEDIQQDEQIEHARAAQVGTHHVEERKANKKKPAARLGGSNRRNGNDDKREQERNLAERQQPSHANAKKEHIAQAYGKRLSGYLAVEKGTPRSISTG